MNWMIQYVTFPDSLLPLSVLFFKVYQCCSMYWYFIPFCRQMTLYFMDIHFYFSIYQLMYIWFVNTFELLWIMRLWTFMYQFWYTQVFISLGYKTRNRFLAHMVTLYLAYWERTILFSKETTPFLLLPAVFDGWFQLFHILANT